MKLNIKGSQERKTKLKEQDTSRLFTFENALELFIATHPDLLSEAWTATITRSLSNR
jgi:hypothetical protein